MSARALLLLLVCSAGAQAQLLNTAPLAPKAAPGLPPSINVPALTLPQGASAPGDAAQQETPNLEFTAVEVALPPAAPAEDERLLPFKTILSKLVPGAAVRLISQEAKPAPFGSETQWSVSDRYDAFVLPMSTTEQGAIRLDARVAQHDAGTTVNALRAEGEVPSGRVMAFRGLKGPGGGELLLLLRQKSESGDQQQPGDGESQEQEDQSEPQDPQQAAETPKEGESQEPRDEQAAQQEEAQQGDAPEDAQNIEAYLQSLEEEDQRQQADARFDRRKIELPSTGEWW